MEVHAFPDDLLEELHTYEDCFCHPAYYEGSVLHRPDYQIDTIGEFISGYVYITPHKARALIRPKMSTM